MSPNRTLFASAAVAVGSSFALMLGGVANAEPASPLPIDGLQAPGMSAVQSISPAIQQAAADPTNAASTLMAAAAAFAGNSMAPQDSRDLASAVNAFVAQPASSPVAAPAIPQAVVPEHVPAPGAVPGTEAHLPAGVNPAHAAGPLPGAAPARGGPSSAGGHTSART